MISLNFIFSNIDERIGKQFKDSTQVKTSYIYEIKEFLLNNLWPKQIDKNKVEYIRFLSMGKELEDAEPLSSYPLPDPSHPLPVHVHIKYSDTQRANPNCCGGCSII